MHTMYLRRCAKCGALRREPRFLGFVKTEVELVCKVNSLASETRNPREGSIHRPRGLSVLSCPFSDGPPLRSCWRYARGLPGLNNFSKAVALLVAERPVKLEPLREGKSQRARPKPPEVQSQTPTSRPIPCSCRY